MKILQFYQSDEDMGINVTGRFEVKTKDKTFATSIFPFLQTDHLTDQLIGRVFAEGEQISFLAATSGNTMVHIYFFLN